MKKFLFLLLSLIHLTGCTVKPWSYHKVKSPEHIVNPPTIPIYIDNGFTRPQLIAVYQAVNEWNYIFNRQIVLEIKNIVRNTKEVKSANDSIKNSGVGWIFFTISISDPGLEVIDKNFIAFVNEIGGNYMFVFKERIAPVNVKTIIMHEIGHLLGAEHVIFPSLMYSTYGEDQLDCIDQVTVNQVAAANNLDYKTLNYCSTPNFP